MRGMCNVDSGQKVWAYSQWLMANGSDVETRLVLLFKECVFLVKTSRLAIFYYITHLEILIINDIKLIAPFLGNCNMT